MKGIVIKRFLLQICLAWSLLKKARMFNTLTFFRYPRLRALLPKSFTNNAFRAFLLSIFLICSACSKDFFTNKPLFLETELSYGPPEFRAGYKDGCESALSAYGNSMQRSMYGLKKDPQYENNRVYEQVWKDSWSYCYMWLFIQLRKDPMLGKSLL